MPYPTLTSRWSNVIVATWAVAPAALAKYLPAGPGGHAVEFDMYPRRPLLLDGRPAAALSLVAMQCTHVRILGVRWPRVTRYTSLALRVCVKQGLDGARVAPGSGGGGGAGGNEGPHNRGFVYIREFISSRVIAWCLRRSFNHPCVPTQIEDEVKQQTLLIGAEYRLLWPMAGPEGVITVNGKTEIVLGENMFRVVGSKPPGRIGEDTLESWLTERPFVFGLDRAGHPRVHEVIHPRWGLHESVDADIRMDFATLFGPDFEFLGSMRPRHTLLSPGSNAAMFPSQEVAGVRWGVRRGK